MTSIVGVVIRWWAAPLRLRAAPIVGGVVVSFVLARYSRRAEATDRVRELGTGSSRLPRMVREQLERALVAADLGSDAGAAVQLWLLAALAAGCLAGGLDLAFAPVAMLAVLVGGPIGLYSARQRGVRRRAADLPVTLELVAAELRTGGTVIGALATLGRGDGPLAVEYARVNRRCALGAPLESALSTWAEERDDPSVDSVAGALAVAATTGGRAADALDGLASSLRDRSEIAAEGRALSAQARLSAIVIGSLPVVYLGASAVLDPRQARMLTGTPFGLACLAVGLTLELLGGLWIRRLLRQDT